MTGVLVTDAPLAHLRWSPAAGAPARPPVLLLHGIGGGREAWGQAGSGTGRALADAGFSVLALDFPGYGLSPAIAPFDLAGLARSVIALIDWVGAGPAVLVGHSMGGMVAQELAALAPGRIAGLVLASTSPAFGKPGGDWQRGFLQSRFAPLDAGLGMAGLAARLVPAMVAPGTAAAAVATAQALMAGVPEATYRAAVTALVEFDRRANLPAVRVPTLVITGEHDATAPPEVSRRMAERIPGAACRIVPGAGHLLNLEQPQAFNAALLAHLGACAGAR
ncbi:MAG: alpha/beta fold hydrolase [Burkholderiaceae bacterium]|nr:alpha/beta fold hydrolase [Burkholderiaceae bacterium]